MRNLFAQNELISNLMPATGLKIVGTGACLPWCSIQLVPVGFQLLNSLWSSLTYFLFTDVPNVFYK